MLVGLLTMVIALGLPFTHTIQMCTYESNLPICFLVLLFESHFTHMIPILPLLIPIHPDDFTFAQINPLYQYES